MRLLAGVNVAREVVYENRALDIAIRNEREILGGSRPFNALGLSKPLRRKAVRGKLFGDLDDERRSNEREQHDVWSQRAARFQERVQTGSRDLTHGVRNERALEVQGDDVAADLTSHPELAEQSMARERLGLKLVQFPESSRQRLDHARASQ